MLLIKCPWCGSRAETEFSCGGEADISRPVEPASLSDEAWADYLFMRKNTRGWHRELWNHSQGCRQWFVVERNTVTYQVAGSSKLVSPATPTLQDNESRAD
ncbi:MAG: sarcosine oxidase subunit delta [Gammaproteobacteria bacterium]|jgi:sarcosine oxidase, subunit delta|nr:sarcosine oxidase subunit delta [Gammaproteobacteria bacterium]MBT5204272.1 sarcosine oxidase subunit delta [Gammaproteobacteria bacterium]MBT5602155.1 sarcosine oxidase subunit delta [Gammaproteobacteria bacterium]MBT6246118.1 sarcosine oxidase subunit delta [Gammaproteobacteria bacterium]